MEYKILSKPRYEARAEDGEFRVFDTFTQSFVEFERNRDFSYAIRRARQLNDAYERALR